MSEWWDEDEGVPGVQTNPGIKQGQWWDADNIADPQITDLNQQLNEIQQRGPSLQELQAQAGRAPTEADEARYLQFQLPDGIQADDPLMGEARHFMNTDLGSDQEEILRDIPVQDRPLFLQALTQARSQYVQETGTEPDSRFLVRLSDHIRSGTFGAARSVERFGREFMGLGSRDEAAFGQFAADATQMHKDPLHTRALEREGFVGKTVQTAEEGFLGAAQMTPDVIASLGASAASGPGGAVAYWWSRIAPDMEADIRNSGVDPDIAKKTATFGSLPVAAVEMLQISQLTPQLKQSAKQATTFAVREWLKSRAKKAGITYVTEMSEEALQEVLEVGAKAAAHHLDENAPGVNWSEELDNSIAELTQAAKAMPFLMGPGQVIESGAELLNLQEMRAKGFITEEDARKANLTPEESKNRASRKKAIDKRIADLEAMQLPVPDAGIREAVPEVSPDVQTPVDDLSPTTPQESIQVEQPEPIVSDSPPKPEKRRGRKDQTQAIDAPETPAPPFETKKSQSDQSPDFQLARNIASVLTGNESIDSKRLHSLAEQSYGGSRAEGAYDPSRANDALELGINIHIAESSESQYQKPSVDATQAKQTIEKLDKLVRESVPPQTSRSGLKDAAQQFSTPPAYAYAVNWIANINENDVVLEPSAGTGSLAVHAKRSGAKVFVNELKEVGGQPNRRAELVGEIGADQVFTEDAEQIHNVLAGKIQPTVVVMNPPFSTAANRMKGKKIQGTDLKHIDAALELMAQDGRLVAIIGAGLHGKNKSLQTWEDGLQKRGYNLKADIELGRDVYKGYGTTFPTRVLVIDKASIQDSPQPLQTKVDNLLQLVDTLEGVRNERATINQPETTGAEVEGDVGKGEGRRRSTTSVRGSARPVDTGRETTGDTGDRGASKRSRDDGDRESDGGDATTESTENVSRPGPSEGGKRGGRGKANTPEESRTEDSGRTRSQVGGESVREPSKPESDPRPTTQLGLDEATAKTRKHELTESVYESYEPRKVRIKGAKPHPASVVESAAMAAIDPPSIDYIPNIPQDTVDSGALSEIQLESIAYAGHSHEQEIEIEGNKYRKGFLIGDGTGIGKGRTAAGIILDNMRQGRTKSLWISKDQKLLVDSKEYSKAVGIDPEKVFSHSNIKSGTSIETSDGILYSTYNTLGGIASAKAISEGNDKSRLDQIVDWLGEDFDGAIVFDEAHKMGNAVDVKAGRGTKKASQMALAGLELQRRLPQARIVYMSATAATEVSNLAYAERLGLWGKGTAFANQSEFQTEITSGGVAAMEKVAADMKAMGVYNSRNISFNDGTEKGTVEYRRLQHTLNVEEEATYNKLADAWGIVFGNMNDALKETGGAKDGRAVSAARSAFWGANQRFWNQIITAIQTPKVIESIEADLKEGRSAVIQLTSTNEAATQRALGQRSEGMSLEELDTSPRGILMDFVERSFPVFQHEQYTDENGNVRSRRVLDSKGNTVKSASAVAMQEQLLDELGSIQVGSRGAIDMIIDHFGTKQVSEITGRTIRLVKDKDGKLKQESRSKAKNNSDIKAFQTGRKRILVFSQAGGTGSSYHADRSVKNQEKRMHYLLQAGWRADEAIQGLGRTHRSNQAQAPTYVLVHTNLKGQKRFISTIARRLSQLGAITKGQRQAVAGGEDAALFSAADNLESTEAKQALRDFYADAMVGRIEGVTADMMEERLGLKLKDENGNLVNNLPPITQFLNRVLSLPVSEQNIVFEAFENRLQQRVEIAQSNGELDQGVETVRADKITKESDRVVHTHESGAETRYVKVKVARKSRPITWEQISKQQPESFVRSKQTGKVMAVIPTGTSEADTRSGRLMQRARVVGPMGVTYGFAEKLAEQKHYDQLSVSEAEQAWNKAVAEAPEFIETDEHYLTGVLLPIWNRIPGKNTRVMRMLTDEGEMILGRQIPSDQVNATLRALGASTETPQLTPKQAAHAVLENNSELRLANDWRIQRRLVGGENRIEVVGPSFVHHGELEEAGVFRERINSKTRYFVPTNNAPEVIESLLQGRPITDVIARSGRDTVEGSGIAQMTNPTKQSRSTTRSPEAEKAGIAAADIQKTAERLFDVAIRHGGFSQRAAGIYKWLTGRKGPASPEVVRTAEEHYANLAVVSHEVAHHIDETNKVVRNMPKVVSNEIKALDYEPEKERAFEGFAEFVRRYLTEPDIDVNGTMVPNPGIDAPQALAWFEETFLTAHADVAKVIKQFRDYAQEYAQQSIFQRVGSMIADRQPQDLEFKERWLEKSRRWVNRLKTNFLDKFHTLEWIQEEARKRGHEGIGIYDLTMAHFMSASSHATIAFEEGVKSLRTGEPLGKTKLWELRDHLESDGEYNDAVLYSLARHTLFMAEQRPGYNTGLSVEDARELIEEIEASGKTDRFDKFARELAQFNNDLLDMLVDAGALPADKAKSMKDAYGGLNYFPLHRVQDTGRSLFAGTGAGFVNLGSAVPGRSRKGSGRQIIDPIDATVSRAIRFYGRAIQSRQSHTLAGTLDPKLGGVGGMGGLMDRVDPLRKVHQGTIEEILGTLVEEGVIESDDAKAIRVSSQILNPEERGIPSDASVEWFADRHSIESDTNGEYDWDAILNAAEQEPDALATISLWRPDYTPNARKRTVVIYDKQGNPLMYEMDPDLYETATGMDELTFGPFMSTLRESARYFKSGAVGLSTGFGTANLIRDYWEFQGKARHTKGLDSLGKPPTMLGRYIAAKARQLTGDKSANPLIRLFEESGGKVYSLIGHDVEGRRRYRRKKIGKSTMSKLGISLSRPAETAENALQSLQDLIAISDAPPRLADAEAAIHEEGFEVHDGKWFDVEADESIDHLPEHVRIKAANAMAEATINFKRIGVKGQYIESFLPFFNATLQALYRQQRQIRGLKSLGRKDFEGQRAKRYMVYLSALAASGLAYWLLRNDDDDWREQDAYLRDGYWTWGKDGKTFLRIPKPRDTAIVSNLVENMLDAWYHDDARDTSDVVLRDFGGRLPTGGGFVRGFIESHVADYDYFRDRDLTPDYMKHLPKEQQVTPYTSRMSETLGQVTGRYMNTSPIQLQHLLNSASGGLYGRLTDTYDAAQDGRIGPEHVPVLRGVVINRHQARSVNDFYEKLKETQTAIQRQKADGKVSDTARQQLAVLDGYADLMTQLRKLEGKVGKRRSFEYQPYIAGLARAALGYKELNNNPNPFTDTFAPKEVQDAVKKHSMRAAYQAATLVKKNNEDSRLRQLRGEAKLKALNVSHAEAQTMLLNYYIDRYGHTTPSWKSRSIAIQQMYDATSEDFLQWQDELLESQER